MESKFKSRVLTTSAFCVVILCTGCFSKLGSDLRHQVDNLSSALSISSNIDENMDDQPSDGPGDGGDDDDVFDLLATGIDVGSVQTTYDSTPCPGEHLLEFRYQEDNGANFNKNDAYLFIFFTGKELPQECSGPLDTFGPNDSACASLFHPTLVSTPDVDLPLSYQYLVDAAMAGQVTSFFALAIDEIDENTVTYLVSDQIESLQFEAECSGAEITGTMNKWHPITLSFTAEEAYHEEDNNYPNKPNPFKDLRLFVDFTAPDNTVTRVEGYFAGDGDGGGFGDQFEVILSADQAGTWTYEASFREAEDIINEIGGSSMSAQELDPIDGMTGSFSVGPTLNNAPGFLDDGRLKFVGKTHAMFSEGGYYLRGGLDSPENILGYAGFDNTKDIVSNSKDDGLIDGVHRFGPHADEILPDDPYFKPNPEDKAACNSSGNLFCPAGSGSQCLQLDTTHCCVGNNDHGEADGRCNSRGIIGLVNYLSKKKLNSVYFILNNIGGDGHDTYPHIEHDKKQNYDISKLRQWRIVVDHMTRRGVGAHFLLNETESDNENYYNNGELGLERKMFYREMVARFGHTPVAKWNIGEEIDFSTIENGTHFDSEIYEFSEFLHTVYPYEDMYLAFHTHWLGNNWNYSKYQDSRANPYLRATSLQFDPVYAGGGGPLSSEEGHIEEWVEEVQKSAWANRWVIDFDEPGPGGEGLTSGNKHVRRKELIWDTFLNGGNFEVYLGGLDQDAEDLSTGFSQFWNWMWYARKFLEGGSFDGESWPGVEFWEMETMDQVLLGNFIDSNEYGRPEVLCHKSGSLCKDEIVIYYAQTYQNGHKTGQIELRSGQYEKRWYNPREGSFSGNPINFTYGSTTVHTIGNAPSAQFDHDWVLVIRKL